MTWNIMDRRTERCFRMRASAAEVRKKQEIGRTVAGFHHNVLNASPIEALRL